MKYMGSKNRIAKHIIPIMLENYKGENFYDLFCGGCNLIDKIPDIYNRYANDYNRATIKAMIMIRTCLKEIPKNNKEFTEEDYYKARDKFYEGYITPFNSYVGYAYSYSGKLWGGWARGEGRDYVAEAYRNAVKQSPKLHGITFTNLSYDDVEIKPNSLIYCDPPYKNTTKYKIDFDHDKFWDWCRIKHKEGHTVYISEYNAPEDFKCVWSKEIVSSLTKDTGSKKGKEKLFTLL